MRRAATLVAALAAWGCGAGPPPRAAPLAVTVAARERYYDIAGATAAALRDQIRRFGPADDSGARRDALTVWELEWAYRPAPARDGCALREVRVTLTLTVTLPRWTPPAAAPADLRAAWRTYLERVRVHEAGHGAIAEAAARELLAALAAVHGPTCDAARAEATRTAERIVAAGRARNRAYDVETRHGQTQGVVLGPCRGSAESTTARRIARDQDGCQRVVGERESPGEGRGPEAECRVHERRRGEREAHEHGGDGEPEVAERHAELGVVAQRRQHDQHVAKDQDGVGRREERVRPPGEGERRPRVDRDGGEGREQEDGDPLLEHHVAAPLLEIVGDGRVPLGAVVQAEHHEDEQRADRVAEHRHDGGAHERPSDRLAEKGELLERLAQQDEREDLEVLAHRVGDGLGEVEREPDALDKEQEREGEMDGVEVAAGHRGPPGGGEEAPAAEFDHDEGAEKGGDEQRAKGALRGGANPGSLEAVEHPRDASQHGGNLERAARAVEPNLPRAGGAR